MMRTARKLLAATLMSMLCAVGVAAKDKPARKTAHFEALEFLDDNGEILAVSAERVSADGSVVYGRLGLTENHNANLGAFRWTPGTGVVDLGLGLDFRVHDVSLDGEVMIGAVFGEGSFRVEGDRVTPIAPPVLEGNPDWPVNSRVFPVAWGMSGDGSRAVFTATTLN